MFDERKNDFSYWFPKVKNCGILVPKTWFWRMSEATADSDAKWNRLYRAFFMDNIKEDTAVIKEWIDTEIIPELEAAGLDGHIFVKNARFSNKFDANRSCNLYGLSRLADAITDINYEALCCGADGTDEIVVRQFIEHDFQNTPCIYNGLPLRTEFRVFYDFDKKQPIFTVNYWDYDYVRPHLYDATDKIIFDHEKQRLEADYSANWMAVEKMVASAMERVDGLTDQWSVDILMDERNRFWLIDMAVAQTSAYWEQRPDKENYPI